MKKKPVKSTIRKKTKSVKTKKKGEKKRVTVSQMKIKRRLTKTKKKYRVTKKISMDDIYRIINRVQLNKKEAKFSVESEDGDTVQNIIRDLELPFDRQDMKTKTVFTVHPRIEIEEEMIFDVSFMEDEIPEDGQIF